MKYNYRTATFDDIAQLQQLGLNAYSPYKAVLTEDNWHKMNSFLMADNTYHDLLSISTCFVCEADNALLGMAFLVSKGNPTKIFDTEWSYIRMVGVHTDHAGKGIGKRLTQLCIDKAISDKENTIALHTSEFMDAARHVYESLGFKRTSELDLSYGKRYWLYKLAL